MRKQKFINFLRPLNFTICWDAEPLLACERAKDI